MHYDGSVYRGEFRNHIKEGYGHMKYSNNDELEGRWKDGCIDGEGVFKNRETGRI